MTEHLADLASSFRRHLRAEGKSERTAVIYGTSIRLFGDWLVARSRPAALDQLSRAAIREWLAELVDAGLAPGTVRTRYKGLHRFCGWLVDEQELPTHQWRVSRCRWSPTSRSRCSPTTTSPRWSGRARAGAGRTGATRRSFGSCWTRV